MGGRGCRRQGPVFSDGRQSNIEGQVEFVRAAKDAGANWVILQPPRVLNVPEVELIRFFGAVADSSEVPVGIQNAPEYIGIGISNASFECSIAPTRTF